MLIYADPILKNVKTQNYLPSKMIIFLDQNIALEQNYILNLQHDVKRQLIYGHVQLVVNQDDNVLMHDICYYYYYY